MHLYTRAAKKKQTTKRNHVRKGELPRQALPILHHSATLFGSKIDPRAPILASKSAPNSDDEKKCPNVAKMAPKRAQKMSQHRPQSADDHWGNALVGASEAQDDVKRRPRGFQEAPRRPKETPGGSKWHQKRPQDTKKGPQRHRNLSKREFRKTPKEKKIKRMKRK